MLSQSYSFAISTDIDPSARVVRRRSATISEDEGPSTTYLSLLSDPTFTNGVRRRPAAAIFSVWTPQSLDASYVPPHSMPCHRLYLPCHKSSPQPQTQVGTSSTIMNAPFGVAINVSPQTNDGSRQDTSTAVVFQFSPASGQTNNNTFSAPFLFPLPPTFSAVSPRGSSMGIRPTGDIPATATTARNAAPAPAVPLISRSSSSAQSPPPYASSAHQVPVSSSEADDELLSSLLAGLSLGQRWLATLHGRGVTEESMRVLGRFESGRRDAVLALVAPEMSMMDRALIGDAISRIA
ncbi:hypothetical protein DFH09DRAFT_1307672 [Mycena vulgaris]|nr:hypothetical protein DFH09DRAFT_1307672 [Mycena vulgaris]